MIISEMTTVQLQIEDYDRRRKWQESEGHTELYTGVLCTPPPERIQAAAAINTVSVANCWTPFFTHHHHPTFSPVVLMTPRAHHLFMETN